MSEIEAPPQVDDSAPQADDHHHAPAEDQHVGDAHNGGGGGDQNAAADSGAGEEVKLYVGNLDYGTYAVAQCTVTVLSSND
jgi:hypothetical protein